MLILVYLLLIFITLKFSYLINLPMPKIELNMYGTAVKLILCELAPIECK